MVFFMTLLAAQIARKFPTDVHRQGYHDMRHHAFCKFVNHFAGSIALEKPYYRWLETVFRCFAQMFTAFNEHKAGPMPENVVRASETWYMQYRVHYNRNLVACLSGRTLNILS